MLLLFFNINQMCNNFFETPCIWSILITIFLLAQELFAQYVAEEGLKASKDKKELNYEGLGI